MLKSIVAVLACIAWCSQAADPQQPTNPIAVYLGTWRATTYNRTMDSVMVTWTWVQSADSSGTLAFGDERANPTRVVFASADSLVFDLLVPLHFGAGHPWEGARQRYVARIRNDSLSGTAWTTVVDGRRGQRPFRGSRVKN